MYRQFVQEIRIYKIRQYRVILVLLSSLLHQRAVRSLLEALNNIRNSDPSGNHRKKGSDP